jgi:hypothetical protein
MTVPVSLVADEVGDFVYPGNYGADYLTFETEVLTAHWPDSQAGETRFNGGSDITEITGTEYEYDALANPIGSTSFTYPSGFKTTAQWANWFVGYLGSYPVWWWVDGHAGLNKDFLVAGGTVTVGEFNHAGGPSVTRLRAWALTYNTDHLWVFTREADGTVRYDVWDASRTLIRTVYYGTDPLADLTGASAWVYSYGLSTISIDSDESFLWTFNGDLGTPVCKVWAIDAAGEFTFVEQCDYSDPGNEYPRVLTIGCRSFLVAKTNTLVFNRCSEDSQPRVWIST